MRQRILLALTLFFVLSVFSSAAYAVTFNPAVNYPVGSYTYSVTTGDFNGDGRTDLAVANEGSGNVSILLGVGDGTFNPAVNYTVGSYPGSVTTGDFNGDGITDLTVTNEGSGNVSILLGVGDGTFNAAMNYTVGTVPVSVTTGDFNGDGITDLAVANWSSGNVSILLGVGDGTFNAAMNYAVGTEPVSVTTGDFNRDGRTDLAVANYLSNDVSILLGVGDGTFNPAVNYAVGSYPYSVTTGDFNRDGITDLAVTNVGSGNVSILLGVGDGTFNPAVNYSAGTGPYSVTTGDFNGDGRTDLAVANYFSGNVSILLGVGDGTFNPAVNYPVGINPYSVTTGDFNGDGRTDLAVANLSSNNVSILINTAPQTQRTLTVTKAGTGTGVVAGGANCTLNWVGNTGTCTVNDGTAITLSGTTSITSTFAGWSNGSGSASGCAGTDNCTFSIAEDSGVTATFTLNQYTIATSANPAGGGGVTCNPNPVNHGSISTCMVTTNTGYILQEVSGCGVNLVNNTYTTSAITASCTVEATFALIPTYAITGRITNSMGSPVQGISVSLTGAATALATTNAQGIYTFSNLASGGYTIIPFASGLAFTPANRSVNIVNDNIIDQNFVASRSKTATVFSISGNITSGGIGLPGVAVTLTGVINRTVNTNVNGTYTFSDLPNGTYTVTPLLAGFTFDPSSRDVTVNNANLTGVNFTATSTGGGGTYNISGRITNSIGGAVSDVTVTLSGAAIRVVTTNANGEYIITGLANGNYRVTPSRTGLAFSPAFRDVSINSGNITGVNFTAARSR